MSKILKLSVRSTAIFPFKCFCIYDKNVVLVFTPCNCIFLTVEDKISKHKMGTYSYAISCFFTSRTPKTWFFPRPKKIYVETLFKTRQLLLVLKFVLEFSKRSLKFSKNSVLNWNVLVCMVNVMLQSVADTKPRIGSRFVIHSNVLIFNI